MANKIKTNPETPLVFMPSGNPFPSGAGFPSGVVIHFNPETLATGIGRISLQFDLGPGPRTTLFEWRGRAMPGANPNVGTSIDAYISTSNSSAKDGNLPTTEGAIVNADKRRNLLVCGSMVVDSGGGTPDPAIDSGLIEIYGRYISVVWWNSTNVPLGTGNFFILTPVPDEIQ
jgi:hypothetical protein